MQSSNQFPLSNVLEIDEFSIGGHEKGKPGLVVLMERRKK